MTQRRGMGGPMGGRYLTEEEKEQQPKVSKELLLRVFSYLKPYRKHLFLREPDLPMDVYCVVNWRDSDAFSH